MTVASEVARKLQELEGIGTIGIHMSAEYYFDTLRAIIESFASKNNLEVIYVTFTIPATSISSALESLEIDTKSVSFVDGISSIMMTTTAKSDRVLYIESPTLLEYLMLKIEFIRRRTKERNSIVILDSINSISIHNTSKVLSEFLHILSNHVRSKGGYFVVLSMKEYETEEVRNILNLICEDRFAVGEVIE